MSQAHHEATATRTSGDPQQPPSSFSSLPGDEHMLAAYGQMLGLWRATAFDLPFAWATAVDMLTRRYMEQCAAHWERQGRCRTWAESLKENGRFVQETTQATVDEAHAFERDVDLVFEQARP